METRKEAISTLKVCRFCLTRNEPLTSLYEKCKAPKNSITFSMKILSCLSIEIFPSDKMPQYICNRCKLFMELSFGFKQICRQADSLILQFIQKGTPFEAVTWPSMLNKVYKAHSKSELGVMKTVIQDGATVKVMAEEISDSEEDDNDNVYSVQTEEGKSIKVITSVNNQVPTKEGRKGDKVFSNMTKLAKHLRSHAGARSYPCKHCDKSFLKSHHYTRHLRVKHREVIRTPSCSYTEAEAYRCDECEETFATQDELMYHSALHATRNLTCPLCQEKFDDVDTVTAHIKSHVTGAEFMCDFCELIFTTQEKLDGHTMHAHENELVNKDTENEEDDSMDTECYEDEASINVKDEGDHMVVEIKKAGDYILADSAQVDEEERLDQSEGSELEITYSEVTGHVIATKPSRLELPPSKPTTPVKFEADTFSKGSPVGNANNDLNKVNVPMTVTATLLATSTASPAKPQINNESPSILKKAEEIKKKVVIQQSSPVPNNSEKREKTIVKVESSSSAVPAGASDLSLRLLEKELQDLQRTSRNDVSKTPAKPVEVLKNKRSQIQTTTPKPKPFEKKEVSSQKPTQEKSSQEVVSRKLGRMAKENKELKNTSYKEEKEAKDRVNVSVKEEKENAKEVKEKDTPKVVKNGATDKPVDEPVRRSTRPSKVKDYAKMIRDSAESEEESSEGEHEEEEVEKSTETPRKGRRPLNKQTPVQKPSLAAAPSSAPRKRGRPRKDQPSVAPKVSRKEESDEESGTEATDENKAINETEPKPADEGTMETKTQSTDPESNLIVSPSVQTLKKVPIKALPPGIKPLPLPRKMTGGEVCEMQIGKKVVKVQKIVMTKAEVEAMTKKGLVEMKDGTIVLKQGIKLPGSGAVSLKSALVGEGEQNKESPKPEVKKMPTRCDLGE